MHSFIKLADDNMLKPQSICLRAGLLFRDLDRLKELTNRRLMKHISLTPRMDHLPQEYRATK